MTSIVLVEGILSGTTQDVVCAAHAQGLQVYAVAQKPQRFEHVADWFADVIPCDTSDPDEIVRTVRSRVPDIGGLTSTQDNYMPEANESARLLGLPCAETEALWNAQEKSRTRDVIARSPLKEINPGYRILSPENRDLGDVSDLGEHVIVKPSNLFGSILVKRCNSITQAQDFISYCFDQRKIAGSILVEQYVPGLEISAEVYDGHCYGLTEVFIAESDGGVIEAGQVHPWQADAELYASACKIAEGVAEHLGLTWGPAHIQFRVDNGRVYLIEVNSRLGGGIVVRIVKEATGIDLATLHVLRLVGKEAPAALSAKTKDFFAAGLFLLASAERSGELMQWDGVNAARAIPGVTDTYLIVPASTHVEVGHSNMDRLAYVTAVGQTRDESLSTAERGLSELVPTFQRDSSYLGAESGLAALSLNA